MIGSTLHGWTKAPKQDRGSRLRVRLSISTIIWLITSEFRRHRCTSKYGLAKHPEKAPPVPQHLGKDGQAAALTAAAAAYRGAAPRMDGSDAEAFVRGCCGTLWHPAGGACRGDALDAESLELRGCEGVCVVGAAAMPALPRVNPSLSCYAMGWRLGELLAAE